ncbi:MAG: hypothetical protein ACREKE_03970, partial [bacterium]
MVLTVPVALRANNDWLGIEVPQPFDAGVLNVSERLSCVEYDAWEDGGAYNYMVNGDGSLDVENLVALDTRLDWRLNKSLYVELDVPTVFNEFSPYSPNGLQYYNVGAPGVEEAQGLGDMGLALRGAFTGKSGAAQGGNAGWILEMIAPTGLGPFDAAQTTAATGAGRWQLIPGLVFGGKSGPWEGWLQARGRVQFGQQAFVPSDAYVDWVSTFQNGVSITANNIVLPGAGGTVWLGPRCGADAVAGLAWVWYQDSNTRLALAGEATAHWLSPWST